MGLRLIFTFSFQSVRCLRFLSILFRSESIMPVNQGRCIAGLCMMSKVQSNRGHCLDAWWAAGLYPACRRVRLSLTYRYEFETSKCRTSEFARWFLTPRARMWNLNSPALCLLTLWTVKLRGFVNHSMSQWTSFLLCAWFIQVF